MRRRLMSAYFIFILLMGAAMYGAREASPLSQNVAACRFREKAPYEKSVAKWPRLSLPVRRTRFRGQVAG
jgi:hypothetical protein